MDINKSFKQRTSINIIRKLLRSINPPFTIRGYLLIKYLRALYRIRFPFR